MGSDKQAEINAAHALNNKLVPVSTDLISRVIGGDHIMSEWLERFIDLYASRRVNGHPLSPDSIRTMESYIRQIRAVYSDRDITSITTKDISDFLDTFQDRASRARGLRSALNTIFRTAIQKGLVENNPVIATRVSGAQVQRERLSLDEFKTI